MRIYPDLLPSDRGAVSGSERWFHKLIIKSSLNHGYVAFHSLGLSNHSKKYIGEIDFAFLTPHGILTIEIKGGVISCEDRVWYTQKAFGGSKRSLPESPFNQARDNMYEFKDDLVQNTPFEYRKDLIGYGVVFPGCRFEVEGQDITKEILFDSRTMKRPDPVAYIINKLQSHWGDKLNKGPSVMRDDTRVQLEKWLKPTFFGVKSLRSDRKARESKMLELLDFQLKFIRSALGNERILCKGGAGTGKTLIGIEYIRILKGTGQCSRPLLIAPQNICSRLLGTHPEIETWPHELLHQVSENCADLIVVDESQDLMNQNDCNYLNKCLIGNLDQGKWLFLLDPLNQAGIKGSFDEDCYHLMVEWGTSLNLDTNVRNTTQIIKETLRLTGRDIGIEGTGTGSSPKWIEYDSNEQRKLKFSELVDDLVRQDLRLNEIAIIGEAKCATEHSASSDLLKLGHKVEDLNADSLENNSFEGIIYSNYAAAKGLEFHCVIIDFGELKDKAFDEPEIYVGLTRATHNVFFLYPKSLKPKIKNLSRRNRQLKSE